MRRAPRASSASATTATSYCATPTRPRGVKDLVAQTNAQRKALYAKRAAEDKAPEAAIGKIYAQQIIKGAPAGTYFLDESGKWTRR